MWEETLDFPGSLHSQFLLLGQFSHTQDGDDILERFEILKQNFNIDVVIQKNSINIYSKLFLSDKQIHHSYLLREIPCFLVIICQTRLIFKYYIWISLKNKLIYMKIIILLNSSKITRITDFTNL